MNIRSLKLVKFNKLTKLGYDRVEANWITNLSKIVTIEHKNISNINDLSNITVSSDGHTCCTDLYTKTIVSSIIKNNYQNWSKYSIHLNYNTIFKYFYSCGFYNLGNEILLYNFTKSTEYEALKYVRNKNEKRKEINVNELAILVKIIEQSKKIN